MKNLLVKGRIQMPDDNERSSSGMEAWETATRGNLREEDPFCFTGLQLWSSCATVSKFILVGKLFDIVAEVTLGSFVRTIVKEAHAIKKTTFCSLDYRFSACKRLFFVYQLSQKQSKAKPKGKTQTKNAYSKLQQAQLATSWIDIILLPLITNKTSS